MKLGEKVILILFALLLTVVGGLFAQTPTPVPKPCPAGFTLSPAGAGHAAPTCVTIYREVFEDPTYANWIGKTIAVPTNKNTFVTLTGKPAVAIPPLPGWWRYGNQYLPCAYTPYTTWTDPVTQQPNWYARYDTAALIQSPQPDGTYGGQGGPNHTDQYYVDNMLQPFMPGDHPPPSWHYPCPVNPDVSALFLSYAFNAGQTCPTSTYSVYSQRIATNPVWLESWAAIKPQHDADCLNPGPTWTPTKTAPPTLTPTPSGPTPTPPPNQFARYIEWASQGGITAGCGGGNFCPSVAVNRDQMTAFLFNLAKWVAAHPGQSPVLPPCATPQAFADVICGGP